MEANKYPLIYYIIQGESRTQDNKNFDYEFLDNNPLIAREKAFDFFLYNISLQNESKTATTNKAEPQIKSEFVLNDVNNFILPSKENDPDEQGVGLYLVVNNTKGFRQKSEQSEERFLLHAENMTNFETIQEIKRSLSREFGLYKYLDFQTADYERTIATHYGLMSENEFETILTLKTPFDFKTFDFITSRNNLFDRKTLHVLNNILHQTSSYIHVLDWHKIRTEVSSFLNTGRGYIFLGNIKNTDTITSVFEGISLTEISTILDEKILNYFPEHHDCFSFEFITINNALIVVIVFKTFVTPCFYDNTTNNNFHYRDKDGINVMNRTPLIVGYLDLQKSRLKDSIQ